MNEEQSALIVDAIKVKLVRNNRFLVDNNNDDADELYLINRPVTEFIAGGINWSTVVPRRRVS